MQKDRQPHLVTHIQLNKRHGHGYQGRLVMEGVIDSLIDEQPFSLDEALAGCAAALEEINKAGGYNYRPHEVVRIDHEAVKANKNHDFTSARFARDIAEGRGELCRKEQRDITIHTVDGQKESYLSGRGTVLVVYFSWLDDKLPKAKLAVQRYCEYLGLHGAGGSNKHIRL